MYRKNFGGLLAVAAVLLLFSFQTGAQSSVNNSGTGGIHVIQGRVFFPDGNNTGTSIAIRLESTNFSTISVFTDGNGAFRFNSLAPGNYSVVVEAGERYEIAREQITIDPGSTGPLRVAATPMIFTVPMYLMPKRGQALRNEIINAKLADVPKNAIDLFTKGLESVQKGKSDDAISEFRQALAVYPRFTTCYVELGKIYLIHGKLNDANASFRSALRIDPQDFDARVNLGIGLMNEKKYDDAEPELVTAALLNKTAVTPHYYIGLMYIEKKQYDIAQKAFETALGLPGGDAFPLLHRYLGGIYVTKGLNKQAVIELNRYLQLAPKAADAQKIRQTISELKAKPEKLNVFS